MSAVNSKILIADPDPDVSRTLQLYFEGHQCQVQCVSQGAEVVGKARQWQPNAILISTEFADTNPYQLCRQILDDTLTSHIPTIMLLHLDDRKTRLDALEIGADDVVTKPFDLEELRLRVEATIRLSTLRVNV